VYKDPWPELDIFVAGTTLLIDNEIMLITGVNYSTNTLTVTRGYLPGSPYYWPIASTHTSGSIIHRPNHISCPLKQILIPTSWLESIVGQVVSGYVRDQNENLILNGIKIVITSSSTSGVDQMNPVNPTTAFYQVFVKNAKYDNRYLLVNQEGKTFDLSYSDYGLPAIIDAVIADAKCRMRCEDVEISFFWLALLLMTVKYKLCFPIQLRF
jgi:hypothetical protein